MNLIQTKRTFATVANAEKHLRQSAAKFGVEFDSLRWMVAVAADGRFAPVIVKDNALPNSGLFFAMHCSVTVVG